MITIQINRFISETLAHSLAQKRWNSTEEPFVNRIRQLVFDELVNRNDCFFVTAFYCDDLVGGLFCIRNESDPGLWYYGDLFVVPEYRRRGIAARMVRAAIDYLSDLGSTTLRCYVHPDNLPSCNLQQAIGFTERPFEPFNAICNEGEIMYEIEIPQLLSVIPATENEAYFVRIMFAQNRADLDIGNVSLEEWKAILADHDADQRHFLIGKGAIPVGYMKIDGLSGRNPRLAMLFVSRNFQRRGIGSFAVHYAENFIREKGFSSLSVSMPKEHIPAQSFFRKMGYI